MSNLMRLNLIARNVGGLGQELKDSEFCNILTENDIVLSYGNVDNRTVKHKH